MTGLLLAYAAVVLLVTWYPFTFAVPPYLRADAAAGPTWHPTDGMVFDGIGMFGVRPPMAAPAEAITDAGALYLYLEAWPERGRQYGPARLFSYSRTRDYQCLMLGHHGEGLALRLRERHAAAPNGRVRRVQASRALRPETWNTILVVATPARLRVYQNGVPVIDEPGVALADAPWRRDSYLVLGNETSGDRGWHGRLRRVQLGAGSPPPAIWRAAGVAAPDSPPDVSPATAPLVTVAASAGGPPEGWGSFATDLWGGRRAPPWSLVPFERRTTVRRAWIDWVVNLALFAPLGWLARRRGSGLLPIGLGAMALSVAVEVGQVFLYTRSCDATDVLLNTLGAVACALVARRYAAGRGAAGEDGSRRESAEGEAWRRR